MWKTITSIIIGRRARMEEELIDANASLIIEQKVREAETGHEGAKRNLAGLIARSKAQAKALCLLDNRIKDLTDRTRAALEAGKQSLAEDAAKLLAELENEHVLRTRARKNAEEKAARLRLALERNQRQLIDLKQGLITARAIEAERAGMEQLKGNLSVNAALHEGEAVLERLVNSADPVAEIVALEELEAGLEGDNVIERLSDAGFGAAEKIRPDDIIARLKAGLPAAI